MEKEIYTPMEQVLIEGIKTMERKSALLKLDQLLLELEAKQDMLDGLKMEVFLL